MGSAEETSINGGASDTTMGRLILSTAMSTVKWLLIIVALGATLFCCLFPYNAMNIFRSFGNYAAALKYCDICINRSEEGGSEYSALLVNAINMSAKLLSEQTDGKPYSVTYNANSGGFNKKLTDEAARLNGYTDNYLNINDETRRSRSTAVDNYNITNIQAKYHPYAYNFEAYVYGEFIYSSQFIGGNGSAESAFSKLKSAVSKSDISEAVIAMNGLNGYYDFEFYRSPSSARSEINSGNLEHLCDYIADIWEMTDKNTAGIDKLFNILTLAKLADNICYAAAAGNYSEALAKKCEAVKNLPDGDYTLREYFNYYLNIYVLYVS